MRDYSGKKAHQYSRRHDTSVSSDTFRSEYSRPNQLHLNGQSKAFDRGGLYSSLRNSLFKLAPGASLPSVAATSPDAATPNDARSPESLSDHEGVFSAKTFRKQATSSLLRELRPSVRRRAHSSGAFGNLTT